MGKVVIGVDPHKRMNAVCVINAKGKVLKQLLQRLVAQSHFFEERAAWGHAELPPLQGRPRHLLALLPDPLIQCVVGCACAGASRGRGGIGVAAAAEGAFSFFQRMPWVRS